MKHRSTFFSDAVIVVALLSVVIVLTVPGAEAAHLKNVPQVLIQPDGTRIECFASGDEHYHWLHDADGFVIVRDPENGFWVWAEKNRGVLVASEHVVGRVPPDVLGLEPRIFPDRASLKSLRSGADAPAPVKAAPTRGTVENLVVFIRFNDEPEFTQTVSSYDTSFNASGTSSMKDYFAEVSYDQLSIDSTFYPRTTGSTVVSYRDSHARAYYQPFDATFNPTGYSTSDDGVESQERETTLLKNAIDAISGDVRGSLDIDANSDGFVDSVVFVVNGSADGWSDLLWPHQWVLWDQYAYINGARVYDYNLQLSDGLGVGVLCHEMFHTLGAPDLYHYSYDGIDAAGSWDLMNVVSDPPQHMTAYMKMKYGNWISSIPEIKTSGTYTLKPLTSTTNNAYKIASPHTTGEYFVVEYRRKIGTFENSVPGSGLIVYRINTEANVDGNADGPPDELYIYRPGGSAQENGSPTTAHFSLDVGRTQINDTTNPSSFLTDGSNGGLDISDVSSAGATISFTVSFGFPDDCSISLSPSQTNIDSSGSSSSFAVTAASGCSWNASPSKTWIHITAGSSGDGNGTVSFTVDANSSTDQRGGTIQVAERVFAITQSGAAACSFSISPTSRSHDADGGTGNVSVSTTSACSWTAASNSSWLSITGGRSGNGNGTVSYTAGANSSSSSRSETLTIAGNTFTVIQSGSGSPPPTGDFTHYAVIAHTSGANNSVWQSSLSITNVSPNQANATLTYQYKSDKSVVRYATIPAYGLVEWGDTAIDLFNLGGKSSGVVTIEVDGEVLVAVRTFNSGEDGTFGQSLPGATSSKSMTYGQYGNINPVRRTSDFRTNIGVINTGSINCSVIVYFVDGDGYYLGNVLSLNLAPGGWKQINEALDAAGINEAEGVYAIIEVQTPGAEVWAYGTVIDNSSGDPTALQMSIEDPSGDLVHYAVIAHTTGANNSVWQSSMSICNTSPNQANATLTYRYKSDKSIVRYATVPAFGLVEWADAVVDLFNLGGKSSGVVTIEVDQPVMVASRTFNSSASGTFGQSLPGASASRSMTYGQVGLIAPVRRTPSFRTNIGVINTGSISCTVDVYFVDKDGYFTGDYYFEVDLTPGGWYQINEAIKEAGLNYADGVKAVIDLQTVGAQVWAYGTVIDNSSGDPTALQMSIVE